MKKLRILFALAVLALGFSSCEDDALKATLKGDVTPNELQQPSSDAYVLVMADKDKTMDTFEWSATDFGFPASITYTIQVDKVGNNFADAATVLTTSNLLEADINVGSFNTILLGLGLNPEEATDVEIRVVSTVSNNVEPVYSNVRTIEVTAYATSFPPIWGAGDALKGWGTWPSNAVEWQSTEYKKYETVTYLTNDKAFRWFAQMDWGPVSYNYPFFTTVDPLFVNANDGDSNLKVVGASGWYKVNVDLTAKTVVAVAVAEPVLYITGGAIGGWSTPGSGVSIKMKYLKPGLFEADATLSNDIFRFFGQADWGPVDYRYPYFETVDSDLILNVPDNDQNFRYIGTPGPTKITVDLNAKTVTLGEPPVPVMYITGDDFGWGWNAGQYESMTYNAGAGTFTITHNFTNGNLFRFFPQKDWSPSYTFDYFTTVDSDLENQGAGTDQNFRYIGTTGSRTITLNMTAKTVSLD